jgi:putative Mg2+ transporter-C (MgtC) family protein
MDAFITYMRELNLVTLTARVILAIIMGGVIGLERGKQGRAAGMRTHILVALGAALTVMIGFFVRAELSLDTDPMRISAQVISGIGFLGVGTIMLKGRFQITGLTTAAGLWATAAIGLALGAGYYEGAIITFIATVLTVTIMHRLEYKLGAHQRRYGLYVEINSDKNIRKIVDFLEEKYNISGIQVTSPRSGTAGNVGIEGNVSNLRNENPPKKLFSEIEALDYVIVALESI